MKNLFKSAIICAAASILTLTSCSNDEPNSSNESNFVTQSSMNGIWAYQLESPITRSINNNGSTHVFNSKGEIKTTYISYYNYIYLQGHKMAAFSNGYYTYGGQNVNNNPFSIPKNSYAKITQLRRTGGEESNSVVSHDDIIIWNAKYDKKRGLVSWIEVTNPMLGNGVKASYTNYEGIDSDFIPCSLKFDESTIVDEVRFDIWQEDNNGNIIDFATVGRMFRNSIIETCYVATSQRVYVRARYALSNREIATVYYDLDPGVTNTLIF